MLVNLFKDAELFRGKTNQRKTANPSVCLHRHYRAACACCIRADSFHSAARTPKRALRVASCRDSRTSPLIANVTCPDALVFSKCKISCGRRDVEHWQMQLEIGSLPFGIRRCRSGITHVGVRDRATGGGNQLSSSTAPAQDDCREFFEPDPDLFWRQSQKEHA